MYHLPIKPGPWVGGIARWLRIGLAVLGVSLPGSPALAQVNVEVLRSSLKASGVGGKLDISVATYHGNTRGTNLGASGLVGVSGGAHLAYAHANGRYSHLGGDVQVANYFAHLRYNYQLAPRLWGEVLAQAESDRFRRLQLRQLLGAGPRFAVFDEPAVALYYGVTYLFEYNRLGAGQPAVRPDVVHRLGNYLSVVLELEDARAVASTTLYYQPRVDDVADYRLLCVSSLDFRVAGHLSAGIHTTLRRESPVPADLEAFDLTVTNSLGLTF